MKKILLTLSLFLGLTITAFAQTISVSGTVTDANGTPLSNYPVHIAGDTTGMFVYTNTVFTNASGAYVDNAIPIANTQGVIHAFVVDSCTGGVQTQTLFYSPAVLAFNAINFQVCGNTASCQATLASSVVDSLATFTANVTGNTGSVLYSWDFGDGTYATTTTNTASHVYTANGTYLACIVAVDSVSGCVAVTCDTVNITSYSGTGGGNCSAFYTYMPSALGGLLFTSIPTGTAPYTYSWDMGDGSTYSTAHPSHTYNAPGLYLACLTITDASGCTSTYCDSVFSVTPNPCQTMVSVTNVNNLTVSYSASNTGVAPFTYFWDFGDGNTSTSASPTHTYAQMGTYVTCLTVTDATGCTSSDCFTVSLTPPPTAGDIVGIVIHDSTIFVQNLHAVVYLIEHDTAAGTLTAIDMDTTFDGTFHFTNVAWGEYYVKAALLPSDQHYSSYLPTYFIQSLYWSSGETVGVDPNMPQGFAFIDLVNGNNVGTGPGFIGGLITQGANGPGDPMPGVEVILFDANMNPITHTVTDANGNYSFADLPYGTYYIYVEELGLQTAPVEVTLSPTTPSMDQVHFEVGSAYVMFTSTNTINSINNIKTFPNPVADELNIQMNANKILDIELSVVNLTGQVLMTDNRTINSGRNQVSILTSELPAGVYMLHIQSNEGVLTQKFVKQ